MKTISIVIATFNEEKNIGRCLASVKDWCKEMIVVDGKSSDETPAIARKLGAKVISVPNQVNFHINKQIAIDRAKGDWVLQLDADEVVSVELKKEIISVINQQLTKNNSQLVNGFWLPRKNYFLGRWLSKGGQYPDYTLRLYKNGKGKLPCKSVHEQADVSGEVRYLNHPLLHYPYPDLDHYLEHFDKYTSIIAGEISLTNRDANGFFQVISYLFLKPCWWFFLTYFRHKGFIDGWQGFVFSFFSALRFPVSFLKYFKQKRLKS